MAASLAPSRDRDRELFVAVEALESFLLEATNELFADLIPDDVVADATSFAVAYDEHHVDHTPETANDLWRRLWPDEEDDSDPELIDAHERSGLLFARLCLRAATRPEVFAAAADRVLHRAQSRREEADRV